MNKLLLTTGLMALLSVGAQAATILYDTTGSELCIGGAGCGVSTQTIGSVVLTFNSISTMVIANPTTISSFGDIVISCVGGGTGCADAVLTPGLTLYIHVNQTVPSVGAGVIPGGVIAGTLSGKASSAMITWPNPNAISVGGVSYSVLNNPLGLVPVSVNGGLTSVQALINSVPEPSSYAMLASGLIGLGLIRRRK